MRSSRVYSTLGTYQIYGITDLTVGTGKFTLAVVGVFALFARRARAYTEADLSLVQRLADYVAVGLAHQRLAETARLAGGTLHHPTTTSSIRAMICGWPCSMVR